MNKLRHKATGKVYDWDGKKGIYVPPAPKFCTNIETVSVRTNCEAYPDECYDFDEDETSHEGHTQYYVEEPLSEFEIIKDK